MSGTLYECAALNFDGSLGLLSFVNIPCTGSLLTPMCMRPTCPTCTPEVTCPTCTSSTTTTTPISPAVRIETSKKHRKISGKSKKKLNSKKKLSWRQKKNRVRRMIGYSKRSVEEEDRQLTGNGIPVDMCLVSLSSLKID